MIHVSTSLITGGEPPGPASWYSHLAKNLSRIVSLIYAVLLAYLFAFKMLFSHVLVVLFVDAPLSSRLSFFAPSFSVLISRIVFAIAAPLSKNRAPRILTHQKTKLIENTPLPDFDLHLFYNSSFARRYKSLVFSKTDFLSLPQKHHPAPRILTHPFPPARPQYPPHLIEITGHLSNALQRHLNATPTSRTLAPHSELYLELRVVVYIPILPKFGFHRLSCVFASEVRGCPSGPFPGI